MQMVCKRYGVLLPTNQTRYVLWHTIIMIRNVAAANIFTTEIITGLAATANIATGTTIMIAAKANIITAGIITSIIITASTITTSMG